MLGELVLPPCLPNRVRNYFTPLSQTRPLVSRPGRRGRFSRSTSGVTAPASPPLPAGGEGRE